MSKHPFHDCRGVLFDFGGTLDSDGEHWLDRFYEMYTQAALDVPLSEIKRAFYAADDQCCKDPEVNCMGLRSLMALHVHLQFKNLGLKDEAKERALVEKFCEKSERFLRRNAQLLHGIRERFQLGVVSNFYGNVAILCEEAGLGRSLDVILDSIRVGVGKPDPEIFHKALGALDLNPQEAVFVGDSYERDMIPARYLGMRTVWLRGSKPRIPLNAGSVDASISSLTELESLIP
jgi:putative hydrolase of the HAD superfamily